MNRIFAGLAGIFVLVLSVGMVAAAWPMLPAMGLISLSIVLALATCAGLVGIYWLYVKTDQEKAKSEAIRLEAAKIHADNSAVFITRTQIAQLTPGPMGYGSTSHMTHYAPRIEYGQPALQPVAAPVALAEPGPLELPTAPAWSELMAQGFKPTENHMLLGYTAAGPLWGSIEDLLSTAIAGRPKMGKTTLLRFISAQLLLIGGRLVILDPHGSIADGSNMTGAEWIATSARELDNGATWLVAELERRLDQFRKGERKFSPLMALCDEWPVINLSSKQAVTAAQRVILEARKTNFYGLISGQGLPASHFGGSLARDALSSRYIFKTTSQQARQAGLDKDNARLVETLERGQAIFEGPINPTLVAIPNVTGLDLEKLAGRATTAQDGFNAPGGYNTHAGRQNRHEDVYSPESGAFSTADRQETIEGVYRELPASPQELNRAYQAFQAGHTSVRKLAAALDIGHGTAQRLIGELKAKGYI